MDRGAWWATIHRVAKSQTRLTNTHTVIVKHSNMMLPGRSVNWHAFLVYFSEVCGSPFFS